jgi:hypothetical protein
MSKRPAPPQVAAKCEMSCQKPLAPFHKAPLLDHKAKSRKQQRAQDNTFEG